jgi:transposase
VKVTGAAGLPGCEFDQCRAHAAWTWLRWQSDSALSVWFRARVGAMGGRIKKIMIVALARKLLVALWRYVKDGVIPDGAKMKAA